jgi:prevent-host-death family protein
MDTTLTATEARGKIYQLIDSTSETHKPITITGKRNNAVLISEDDWLAIQETLYLQSIPGMRESIKEGLDAPLSDCSDALEW